MSKGLSDLRGRTAVITGASRGLGVHLARALATEGMNLVLAARSAPQLAEVAAGLSTFGVRIVCVPTDVCDPEQLDALVAHAVEAFGTIDVLVNNAGLEQGEVFTDFPWQQVQQILDVNLRAPMMLTQLVLPHMLAQGAGHVVNIASVAGLVGVAYNEAYGASKHGVVGFTRSLEATADGEGWPLGFSAILPGFIAESGMYEDMKGLTGRTPLLAGVTTPQKVAAAMVRAIHNSELEVVVNPRPFRPLAILLLLFPGATRWLLRITGATGWFKAVAEGRRSGPG